MSLWNNIKTSILATTLASSSLNASENNVDNNNDNNSLKNNKTEQLAETITTEVKLTDEVTLSYLEEEGCTAISVKDSNVASLTNVPEKEDDMKFFKDPKIHKSTYNPNSSTGAFYDSIGHGVHITDWSETKKEQNKNIKNLRKKLETASEAEAIEINNLIKEAEKISNIIESNEEALNVDARVLEAHEKEHANNNITRLEEETGVDISKLNPHEEVLLNSYDEVVAGCAEIFELNNKYKKNIENNEFTDEMVNAYANRKFSGYLEKLKSGLSPNSKESDQAIVEASVDRWNDNYKESEVYTKQGIRGINPIETQNNGEFIHELTSHPEEIKKCCQGMLKNTWNGRDLSSYADIIIDNITLNKQVENEITNKTGISIEAIESVDDLTKTMNIAEKERIIPDKIQESQKKITADDIPIATKIKGLSIDGLSVQDQVEEANKQKEPSANTPEMKQEISKDIDYSKLAYNGR